MTFMPRQNAPRRPLGSRFVPLSPQQVDPSINNGTVAGGLAYALQKSLSGLQQGRDRRQEEEARRALIEGAQAGDPMGALSQLEDNPYAEQFLADMSLKDVAAAREQSVWQGKFDQEAELKRELAEMRQAAASQNPAAVQEFQYFSQLPPDEQQRFLTLKRAQKVIDLGNQYSVTDPLNPGQSLGNYSVGLPPQREIQPDRVVTVPPMSAGSAPQLGQGGAPVFQGGASQQFPQAPQAMTPGVGQGGAGSGGVNVQDLPPTLPEIRAEENKQRLKGIQSDLVNDEVHRALGMINDASLPVTGIVGQATSMIPQTSAHALGEMLFTIRSNIGFDKLQAMREASPTGGALGQVSEKENAFLQATFGSLAQSQSSEHLQYNIKRLFNAYNDIVHGVGGGPQRFDLSQPTAQGPAEPAPALSDAERKELEYLRHTMGAGR